MLEGKVKLHTHTLMNACVNASNMYPTDYYYYAYINTYMCNQYLIHMYTYIMINAY